METKGRLIAGSHNRNEFVLINADEIGRVSALLLLLLLSISLFFSAFFSLLILDSICAFWIKLELEMS